jgi:acyl-CoA synthetase (AMP-forming)/AMP-acid ligase II
MFNSSGENIYSGDVERMLEKHPDVSQAAVVPIDDEIKGQKPVAFIIPKAGHRPSEDEIKQFALANGSAYQHRVSCGLSTNYHSRPPIRLIVVPCAGSLRTE